ncbi:small integral membrane protein 20 [Scomber scombrus]|uniref:Small integral membrane protein 20 n=1 Tax=Scomber scombrus TaxID=13677 RepID=A0AAV1N2Z9_SCOSC
MRGFGGDLYAGRDFCKHGLTLGAVAAAFYPIFFYPMTHNKEYRDVQNVNRAGINQADVQPVGLKVWSDPFKPTDK